MREIEIIKNFYKGKYPNDDCYFDGERLYSTDTLVEGTHFLHQWSSPQNLARKLIEVNVSDILASGGIPEFCFLNLGLSHHSKQKEWISNFTKRFIQILNNYNIQLVGGDSFFSERTSLNLTIVSKKQKHKPITRANTQVNDFLYITGAVGFSYLGYKLLKSKTQPSSSLEKLALKKHLEPKSKINLQKDLLKFKIHSMIDISDGLIQDIDKLKLCSNVGFIVYVEKLPKYKILRKYLSTEEILTSGEELELLFTSSQKIEHPSIHYIGYAIREKKIKFLLNGKEISIQNIGFEHFL